MTNRQILNFWRVGMWLNVISGILHGVGYLWYDYDTMSAVICLLNIVFAYVCAVQVSKAFWYV